MYTNYLSHLKSAPQFKWNKYVLYDLKELILNLYNINQLCSLLNFHRLWSYPLMFQDNVYGYNPWAVGPHYSVLVFRGRTADTWRKSRVACWVMLWRLGRALACSVIGNRLNRAAPRGLTRAASYLWVKWYFGITIEWARVRCHVVVQSTYTASFYHIPRPK